MNFIVGFILLVFFYFIPPEKKEVKKAINEKIENNFGSIENWYTKNDDSCFYKADTIRLFHQSNFMYHSNHVCDFVVWSFSNESKVDFSEEKICQEPPLSIGFMNRDHLFHYSLKQKNGNLILTLENKFSKQSFKIIELQEVELWEKGDKCKELTLVRVK